MNCLEDVIARRNNERHERFAIEQQHLSPLPAGKLDTDDVVPGIRVSISSTIQVRRNTYSVPSRLIGEKVDVRIGAEWINVTHRGIAVQRMPRLIGVGGSAINYRHVIDSLVRKPGSFENYQYREDMFPTTHFRMAYDALCDAHSEKVAVRKYLEILALAAHESQDAVQDPLRVQIQASGSIDVDEVRELVAKASELKPVTDVEIEPPALSDFDTLLQYPEMESQDDEPIDEQENRETGAVTGDEREQAGNIDNGGEGLRESVDRTVPGASVADVPGPLPGTREPSGQGEPQSSGISLGADDAGMSGPAGKPDQSPDAPIASAAGQNVGVVRLRATSAVGDPPAGEPSRRIVLGSPRKPSDFWKAGRRKEPCPVRAGLPVGRSGTEDSVHDVQLAGSTTVGCQAGSSS